MRRPSSSLRIGRSARPRVGANAPGGVRPGCNRVPRRSGRPLTTRRLCSPNGSSASTTRPRSSRTKASPRRARLSGRGAAGVFPEEARNPARCAVTGEPWTTTTRSEPRRIELNAGAHRVRRLPRPPRPGVRCPRAARVLALDHAGRRAAPLRHVVLRRARSRRRGRRARRQRARCVGWVRPLDALAQHADGRIDLIFPTEMSLRALSHYDNSCDSSRDLDASIATAEATRGRDRRNRRASCALAQDAGRRRCRLDDPAARLHPVPRRRAPPASRAPNGFAMTRKCPARCRR